MFPVYTGMNPYPYHKDQFPSAQYYHHPNWEAIPPQKKEEPLSSSCYESWPHNCGYPTPIQYNTCCAHAQHPAYYNFRPPCSHFPPPPPPVAYNHFCSGYPSYPQSHPMYYPPPPQYSPIYEYDKTVPRDQFHCCGCVDHRCHPKGHNNVKIEEQEPDVDTKKSESLFPGKSNNFTYPIFWIPPGYAMTKEDPRRLAANEVNGQQVVPYVKKPEVHQGSIETEAPGNEGSRLNPHPSVQSAEEGPNLTNGWFPLDINSIKKLMEGGDALRAHDQERRSGHEKKLTTEKGKYTAGDDDIRLNAQGGDKKNSVKIIPVKQLEESVPKYAKKQDENKGDEAPVTKTSQGSVTNSVKKSKLPPICLRVDPPKKKNSNGSSRSASPPGDKKHRESAESSKKIEVEDVKGKALGLDNIEASHGAGEVKKGSDNLEDKAAGAETEALLHTDSDKADDSEGGDGRMETQKPQAAKVCDSQKESKQEKEVMSEEVAAIIIQSVYRGYDVRRWEPLKKLKQIAKVREEAVHVKKHIEDLASVAIIDDKEKTAIGESIMKLLLKLDSIQGLHQGTRDFRRSIAKELIMLQEKLDSIPSQKSTLLAQDIDHTAKESEDLAEGLGEPSDSLCLNRGENATAPGQEGLSSSDLTSIPHRENVGCEEKETSEASLINIESQSEPQDEIVVLPSRSNGDDTTFSLGFELKEEPIAKESSPVEVEDSFKAWPVEDTVALSDSVSGNVDEKAVLLSELPREIVDESLANMCPIEHITAQNDLVSQNEDQNQCAPSGQDQDIAKESATNVSSVEDTAMQNDIAAEAQEDDQLRELARDNVEDEKETPLAECDQGSPNFTLSGDGLSHDVGSRAEMQRLKLESLEIAKEIVTNVSSVEDTTVQNDIDAGNVAQEGDKLREMARDNVEDVKETPVAECDQGSPNFTSPGDELSHEDAGSAAEVQRLKLESQEIMNDDRKQLTEADTSGYFSNEDAADKLRGSLEMGNEDRGPEMRDEDVVIEHENHKSSETSGEEAPSNSFSTNIIMPVTEEVETKLPESTVEEMVSVLEPDVIEEVLKVPSSKEKEGEEGIQESQEMSNMGCPATTISIMDAHVEEDAAPVQHLEDQSTVVGKRDGDIEKKIIEENVKLREMLEKLLAAGKEQQEAISNLNGKVKNLEKKLVKRKKIKSAKYPRVKSPPSCM